jgi:serine/threonine protein kinase
VAKLVDLGGEPVNAAEREVLRRLVADLPAGWSVIPNASLPHPSTGHSYEYDAICVGPHAVYVVEVKGWRGRVRQLGQADWQLEGGRVERNPLTLADQKARVLATRLKSAVARPPYVQACLASGSDDTAFEVYGLDARRCLTPSQLVPYLLDPAQLGRPSSDHRAEHAALVEAVTGSMRARRAVGRRYGSWVATSLQERDEERAIWFGKHALLDDGRLARISAWYLSAYRYTPEARAAEHARRRRAADALAKMGDHPRIARLLEFGEADGEFYEVTEWSRAGTLQTAFVRGALGRLSPDHRLRIVRDIAEGLDAAARHGVFHRALSPEAVLLDAEGRARLTAFDLAWFAGAEGTVYGKAPPPHAAFVAPELRDPGDYEVFDNSDLYSLAKMARFLFEDGLSSEARALLDRCLAEDPADRPEDPAAFLRALDALAVPTEAKSFEAATPDAAASDAAPAEPVAPRTESAPAGPATFEPGDTLDGVNLVLGVLGRGRGATVYRVANEPLGRELALKLVTAPPEGYDPAAELRLLRAVDSPHVPRAHWLGRLTSPGGGTVPYLLLDLVEGERLSELLARGPLPVARALDLGDDLLAALAALHGATGAHGGRAGVLHRDVKPDNIVVGPRGAVLVDFGSARDRTDAGRAPEGTLRTTPPDLSDTGWEPQADVFAAACVLYEALAGRPPWEGAPTVTPPVALDAARANIPRAVAGVIARALLPRAADRFADAASLRDALRAARSASLASGSWGGGAEPPRNASPAIGKPVAPVERAPVHGGGAGMSAPPDDPPSLPSGGTRTSLAATVEEAGSALWTAARAQAVTRHPDLVVPLAFGLRACVVPPADDSPEAARDALLASEARAQAFEAPLPEAMPLTYDALLAGLLPASLDETERDEQAGAPLALGPLLAFDALHFTEWLVIEAAARALGRTVRAFAWAPAPSLGHASIAAAFDEAPPVDATRIPRGDRAAVDLGGLLIARRRAIEDALLAALAPASTAGSEPLYVIASEGLVYLGHGLRQDVGEGLGDRADAARAAWSAAFPTGRAGPVGPPLPSRLPRGAGGPTRTSRSDARAAGAASGARRYPVGRLAWPDPPGTPWLQSGGLSLPERVSLLFLLEA